MAQFTNQAQLSYGNVVTSSNVAVGEILEALSVSKAALLDSYTIGDTVTYIISLVNASSSPLSSLIVSDNLGAYPFGTTALVPLTYVDGSVKYFVDGVLQAAPSVNVGTSLVFSPLSVPANGNGIIVYEARVNEFAPAGVDGSITNSATVSGSGITPITASETINAGSSPRLSITKAISPVPVSPNGVVSYTFTIENTGNLPLTADDAAVITDTFDPLLSNISVTFNGVTWNEGENYVYNEQTGEFSTIAGQVTVDAATYNQNPTTGEWTILPATSTLVITGNIG